MRVGEAYRRQHDRPGPGRRYHAARPGARAAPAPGRCGVRGNPAPGEVQLGVRSGAGVPAYCAYARASYICMRDLQPEAPRPAPLECALALCSRDFMAGKAGACARSGDAQYRVAGAASLSGSIRYGHLLLMYGPEEGTRRRQPMALAIEVMGPCEKKVNPRCTMHHHLSSMHRWRHESGLLLWSCCCIPTLPLSISPTVSNS